MTKEEIKKKLEDRLALSDKTWGVYQQIQGQIVLLRDLLAELEKEDKGKNKPNNKEEK